MPKRTRIAHVRRTPSYPLPTYSSALGCCAPVHRIVQHDLVPNLVSNIISLIQLSSALPYYYKAKYFHTVGIHDFEGAGNLLRLYETYVYILSDLPCG